MNLFPDDSRSLVFQRQVPHPPEKVWRALTESWLMDEWLLDNDFMPVVGHRFTVRGKSRPGWSGVTHCEVLTVEAPLRLAYRWGDGTESVNGLRTLVTWNLTANAGGTLIHLEHCGFGASDELSARRIGALWPVFLQRMDTLLGAIA